MCVCLVWERHTIQFLSLGLLREWHLATTQSRYRARSRVRACARYTHVTHGTRTARGNTHTRQNPVSRDIGHDLALSGHGQGLSEIYKVHARAMHCKSRVVGHHITSYHIISQHHITSHHITIQYNTIQYNQDNIV